MSHSNGQGRAKFTRWAALAVLTVSAAGGAAHADASSSTPCSGSCNSNDIGCLLQQLICGEEDMATSMAGVQTELANLNTSVDTHWTESNQILSDGLGEIQELSDYVQGLGDDAMSLGNEYLSEYKRTNDLIETFLDPGHAFVWAAAAAAGAVVGTQAVNLAIDGLVAGGKKLMELMKGIKREKDIYGALEEMRIRYFQTRNQAVMLQTKLDGLLGLLKLQQEGGLSRDSLILNTQDLDELKTDLEREMRVTQGLSDELYFTDRPCSDRYHGVYKGVKSVHDLVTGYEGIEDTLKGSNQLTVCEKLGEISRLMVKAEIQLSDLADQFQISGHELFRKVQHNLALKNDSAREASAWRHQRKTRRVALAVVDYVWDAYYRDLKSFAKPYIKECMWQYVPLIPWGGDSMDQAKIYQKYWYKCLDEYVEAHPDEKHINRQMIQMRDGSVAMIERFFDLSPEELDARYRKSEALYMEMVQEEVRFMGRVGGYADDLQKRVDSLEARRQRINQVCGAPGAR